MTAASGSTIPADDAPVCIPAPQGSRRGRTMASAPVPLFGFRVRICLVLSTARHEWGKTVTWFRLMTLLTAGDS